MILPNHLRLFQHHVYQRFGPTLVRLWRETSCQDCDKPLSIDHLYISARSADLIVAGVHQAKCPEPETAAAGAHNSYICKTCLTSWLSPLAYRKLESSHG